MGMKVVTRCNCGNLIRGQQVGFKYICVQLFLTDKWFLLTGGSRCSQ